MATGDLWEDDSNVSQACMMVVVLQQVPVTVRLWGNTALSADMEQGSAARCACALLQAVSVATATASNALQMVPTSLAHVKMLCPLPADTVTACCMHANECDVWARLWHRLLATKNWRPRTPHGTNRAPTLQAWPDGLLPQPAPHRQPL
jgi:hypothetical protein